MARTPFTKDGSQEPPHRKGKRPPRSQRKHRRKMLALERRKANTPVERS